MPLGTRRIVAAALLALGSVYAGFHANPVIAVVTLALSAACGAAITWLAIGRRMFRGGVRPAWQVATLAGIGAAVGIFASGALEFVGGPSASWLVLAALLAGLGGGVGALRLSPYGEKMLE